MVLTEESCNRQSVRCSRCIKHPKGRTNYICVDRHDIMKSTFSELEAIQNYHITFEVDFMGELARDLG